MPKETTSPSAGTARAPRRRKTATSAEPSPPPPPGEAGPTSQPHTAPRRRRAARKKPEQQNPQIEFVVGGEKFQSHDEAVQRLTALKELARLDSLAEGINARLPKPNKTSRKFVTDVLRSSVLAGCSVDVLAAAFRLVIEPAQGFLGEPRAPSTGGEVGLAQRTSELAQRMSNAAVGDGFVEEDPAAEVPQQAFGAPPPPFTPPPFTPPPFTPPPMPVGTADPY